MKHKKVYIRLIATYLVVFLVPMIMQIHNLNEIGKATGENICRGLLANLNRAGSIVDDNLTEINTIVQNITANSTIRYIALLMDEDKKYIEISKLLYARDYMKTMKIQTFVDEYYLYFRNNDMVISSDHIFQDASSAQYSFCYDGMEWEEWMEKMDGIYTHHFFPEAGTRQNASVEDRILYVQSLVTDAGVRGNYVFPIRSSYLKTLLTTTYISGPGWAYVTDGAGNVLLRIPSETGEFQLAPEEFLESGEAMRKDRIDGRQMEIVRWSSATSGLTWVAMLPEEYVAVQVRQAQKRTLFMVFGIVVAGLGCILTISWYRGRKIDNILQMLFLSGDSGGEELRGDEMTYISRSLRQLIANNSDLRENIRRQEPVTRELMLEKLLRGGNLDEGLEEYGIHLTDRRILVIAWQIGEKTAGEMGIDAREAAVYKEVLLKKLKEILGGEQYLCNTDISCGAVICTMEEAMGEDGKVQFTRAMEELCGEFRKKDGVRLRLAVGKLCGDTGKISRIYDQLYEMLQYGTDSERLVLFQEDYLKKEEYYYFPVPLEERLVSAVRLGDRKGMNGQLQEIWQVNVMERSLSPSMMHFLVNDLQCTVFKALHSLSGHVEIGVEEIYAQLEQLNREDDILLRFNRINRIFQYICEKVQEETSAGNSRQKKEVERYLQENYRNSDLSLTKIADDFGYASTYFSRLFKELFHENFVGYLERIRIEEACRLLETGMKLEDIALRTGYNSVYVMRTAFKRIKGMTPNDYRKNRF